MQRRIHLKFEEIKHCPWEINDSKFIMFVVCGRCAGDFCRIEVNLLINWRRWSFPKKHIYSYTIKMWNERYWMILLRPLQEKTCKDTLRSTDILSSSVLLLELASVSRSALARTFRSDASDPGKFFSFTFCSSEIFRPIDAWKCAWASKLATRSVEVALVMVSC